MTKIDKASGLSIRNGLATAPRWVAWCEELRPRKDGTKLRTKIPYDPSNGHRARIPTDPSTWGSRKAAEQRWRKLDDGQLGGVGIVLGNLDTDHLLMGVDLDRCIAKSGCVLRLANEVIERFNTYTEVSPSGRGVKLLFLVPTCDSDQVYALLGGKTRKSFAAGKHREMAIDRARFYAVTDDQLEHTPETLRTVSVDDVRWFVEQAGPRFLDRYKPAESTATPTRDESGSGYGFRFLQDCKQRRDNYQLARAAILEDRGRAGDWARCKDERDIERAWEAARNAGKRKLTTRPLSEFNEREFTWLWDMFVPMGMVTCVFGDGGVGKTTVTYDIAAHVTTNRPLPFTDEAVSGSVLIMTKEDAVDTIIKPRLRVAGADLKRVHMVGYTVPDDPEDFDPIDRLDTHLAELEEQIVQLGDVKLLMVDPAADFAGNLDLYRDADVRKLLEPLVRLARRHDLAVIVIIHINKNQEQAARHRGMGSLAFRNVPRSALLVAADPIDRDRRIMVQTKSNLTRGDNLALGFRIEQARDGKYTRIEWNEKLDIADPDELLSNKKAKQSKQDQARQLLMRWLADGPMLQTEIGAKAKEHGISMETMRIVKDSLDITSSKGKGGCWRWNLPV